MRLLAMVMVTVLAIPALAAELESRVLTHYVPQDMLDAVVRTEGWTEIPLAVKGGIRKGDVVRIWSGGLIDHGDSDQPGENAAGPEGIATNQTQPADPKALALSPEAAHAYAMLYKNESAEVHKSVPTGKPLEITMNKDNEKLFVGFNDEKGHYNDNHIGKGRRHEKEPLWVRIEVVRMVVD